MNVSGETRDESPRGGTEREPYPSRLSGRLLELTRVQALVDGLPERAARCAREQARRRAIRRR